METEQLKSDQSIIAVELTPSECPSVRDTFSAWVSQLTRHTATAYRADVLQFAQFAGVTPQALPGIQRQVIFTKAQEFVESLAGQASATIARKISSVRSYFQFICNLGLLQANPVQFIKVGKVHNKDKDVLTDEEVQAIIAVIDKNSLTGMRNLLVIQLLTELGLRRSEITGLTYGSMKESADGRKTLKVIGKREKERTLPISQAFLENLAVFRKKLGVEVLTDEMFLLPNREGGRISGEYIYKMIQNYADVADINKKISPHSFRHYAITDAAKVEDNMLALMEFSGHSNIQTLKRYTHFKTVATIQFIQDKRGVH